MLAQGPSKVAETSDRIHETEQSLTWFSGSLFKTTKILKTGRSERKPHFPGLCDGMSRPQRSQMLANSHVPVVCLHDPMSYVSCTSWSRNPRVFTEWLSPKTPKNRIPKLSSRLRKSETLSSEFKVQHPPSVWVPNDSLSRLNDGLEIVKYRCAPGLGP